MQYLWLAKAIKSKEMTENLCTSNDCHFTYMLDFILKPGGKLEYQDNASLSKFKEKPEYRHLSKIALEICLWVKDFTSLKELVTTTGTRDFACVSENGIYVYKQISSLLNIHVDKCVLILRLFLFYTLKNFTYMYWMNILKGYLWLKSFNLQVTSQQKRKCHGNIIFCILKDFILNYQMTCCDTVQYTRTLVAHLAPLILGKKSKEAASIMQ